MNHWYDLSERDDLAEAFDSYKPLPDSGQSQILDGFLASKNLTHQSLLRLGARLSDDTVLAFPYEVGIKYRDIVTGRRWAYHDSRFKRLKIVRHGADPTARVLLAEGETDAAWLAANYPLDVAVLPAGALKWTDEFRHQLDNYEVVYVALDNDEAGEKGARQILSTLKNGVRVRPKAKDWCEANEIVPLPEPDERPPDMVFGRLSDKIEIPEIRSWFTNALLPIGGLMIIHGREKSFKSWLALDMGRALATGTAWSGFEMEHDPGRVAVVQFEIPLGYFSDRIDLLYLNCKSDTERDNFNLNFGVVTPVTGVRFNVNRTEDQEELTRILVENKINILIFDPVRRAMRGANMNVEHELDKMLGFFEELNHRGITVVACHHDNKGDRRGGDPLDMTGSSRFAGDPDTIVNIELPKGKRVESPERNVSFLTRNAPSPAARSFRMDADTGLLIYNDRLLEEDDDGHDDANLPAI